MSSSAQVQFAAEFVTFLVAAAGLVLVLLNAQLTTDSFRARVAFGLGYLCLAAASFGHGSLLLHESSRHAIAAVRGVGIVLLGLGSLEWRGGEIPRRLLWFGLGLLAIATAIEAQASGIPVILKPPSCPVRVERENCAEWKCTSAPATAAPVRSCTTPRTLYLC